MSAFPNSSPDAPRPITTYTITAAEPSGVGGQYSTRLDLPNSTVWDIVRVWGYMANPRPLWQSNFNGGNGAGVGGPGGNPRGCWAWGGIYKNSFGPSNEIQMFPFFEARKTYYPIDQPIRIGIGELLLAVTTVLVPGASQPQVGGVVYGVEVIEYPVRR